MTTADGHRNASVPFPILLHQTLMNEIAAANVQQPCILNSFISQFHTE